MPQVGVSRVLLAMLLLVLSACQIDVDVDLDVASDGSGAVTLQARLDDDAQQTIGDLESQLRVNDLERAGWVITTEQTAADDTQVTATKPVADASQWQTVLDELVGPGVFTNVDVTIEDNRQELAFDLDLSDGWDVLSDDEATAALGGESFGALAESFTDGRAIDGIISLNLEVSVSNFDDGDPTVRNFSPRFDEQPQRISVEATSENSTGVLLRWIAYALFSLFVLAAVLAITGIVLQRRADRLRPAPTPASLASRLPGAAATATVAPVLAAGTLTKGPVRLVVVEALSVLYSQPHVLEQQLLPFVREQGGAARADTIAEGLDSVLTGAMDTASFWELCGVHGSAPDLDRSYVAGRRLNNGAAGFLAEMQRRRIPVAATTNDAATWSTATRERDRLSAIWPWLISSDVGTTTSDVAMFEVLRRESSIAHGHCLYVDTNLSNLDAARELGMKTALFDAGDLELPAVIGHTVVTDLTELLG